MIKQGGLRKYKIFILNYSQFRKVSYILTSETYKILRLKKKNKKTLNILKQKFSSIPGAERNVSECFHILLISFFNPVL